MEPFTLDRNFHKQDIIDKFSSIIWTERYYGDSEVELVIPSTSELLSKLPLGIFLGIDKSDEVMILETVNIEDKSVTFSGISLLKWLNNRFVRTTDVHSDKNWYIEGIPGAVLWEIVYNMCVVGSPYLNGTINTGVPDPEKLAIPGLGLNHYNDDGDVVPIEIPYGPVYTALETIAKTYQIGMQITLDEVTDTSYILGFRSYRGIDRTGNQTENSPVRFSAHVDSLTDIKELLSISELKTSVYAYAPQVPPEVAGPPGISNLTGPQYVGFDLRALLVMADDVTSELLDSDPTKLEGALSSRAFSALAANSYIAVVDGEIVPTSQFKYGVHYNLGDIIETEGSQGIIAISRVTEYIRAQDSAGEREYPTLEKFE